MRKLIVSKGKRTADNVSSKGDVTTHKRIGDVLTEYELVSPLIWAGALYFPDGETMG